MNPAPVLLLTRPKAQSESFLKLCETRLGRKITSVISPVMRIQPLETEQDLDARTIVVTSANAVRILGGLLDGRQVATVGKATAALAATFGADARCLGETAEDFLERSGELVSPVMVARGKHARLDLAEALNARGIKSRSVTAYDQVAEPLSFEAKSVLEGEVPVVAPVFSPRSAHMLSASAICAPITVLAMSNAVKDAWSGPGEVHVAERPTAEAMCDLVADLL